MRFTVLLFVHALTIFLVGAEPPLGDSGFSPTPERPVGWRGDGSGFYPAAKPVTSWNLDQGANIRWVAEVPYWGTATPVVAGDAVITTCEPYELFCYDAADGSLRWHASADHLDRLLGPAKAAQVRKEWLAFMALGKKKQRSMKDETRKFLEYGLWGGHHRAQGHTFPTPVCDGERVYTAWGNNTATCFDLATGEIEWQVFFGPLCNSGNGFRENEERAQVSSWNERWVPSPHLIDGLFITLQGGIMHALDADTGQERWRWYLKDNLEPYTHHDKLVRRDGQQAHWGTGTPVVLDLAGTKVLVTSWGHVIRAKDGKVLCPYVGAMGDTAGASPVADDERDIVVFPDYQDGGSGCSTDESWAVKLTLVDPDRVAGEVLWHHDKIGTTGGSMITAGGVLFDNQLRAADLATGSMLADGGPGGFNGGGYGSPALAGDLFVHFRDNEGSVVRVQRSASGVAYSLVGSGQLRKVDGKKSPLKDTYQRELQERAEKAIAAGVLRYVDLPKAHGGWADTYGSSPVFHGDAMYVRTRLGLYCIAP